MKKHKPLLVIIGLVTMIIVGNYRKSSVDLSNLALQNVEALASSAKEVTCVVDSGDVCKVGSVEVPDWDEKETWF